MVRSTSWGRTRFADRDSWLMIPAATSSLERHLQRLVSGGQPDLHRVAQLVGLALSDQVRHRLGSEEHLVGRDEPGSTRRTRRWRDHGRQRARDLLTNLS